jgi:SulP family sulfate permease
VFTDLTFAVEVGLLLAAVLYVRNVTVTTTVSMVTPEYVRASRKHSLQEVNLPDYVRVFRIHGPFLFGSTDKLEVITNQIDALPPIVMLRLRNMTAIDATGLRALEELAAKLVASGRHLIVCGARSQPKRMIHRAEFEAHVGRENICDSITAALKRARQLQETPAGGLIG